MSLHRRESQVIAIVDAKMKDVDVVVTNRTFNHRTFQHYGDKDGMFEISEEVDKNYTNLAYSCHYWYSVHSDTVVRNINSPAPAHIEKSIKEALSAQSMSTAYQNFNKNWYDNMDSLYNFKHIIKLSLMFNPNDIKGQDMGGATWEMTNHFGVEKYISEQLFLHDSNKPNELDKIMQDKKVDPMTAHGILKNELLMKHDLIVSMDDDHWSPKGNKWAFDNYILPKVVDILS